VTRTEHQVYPASRCEPRLLIISVHAFVHYFRIRRDYSFVERGDRDPRLKYRSGSIRAVQRTVEQRRRGILRKRSVILVEGRKIERRIGRDGKHGARFYVHDRERAGPRVLAVKLALFILRQCADICDIRIKRVLDNLLILYIYREVHVVARDRLL